MLMEREISKINIRLDSIVESIADLSSKIVTKDEFTKSISSLPTRNEMNSAIENAVDDLARTVAVGFASVDKRFDSLYYTRNIEHEKLDIRVKRLERMC